MATKLIPRLQDGGPIKTKSPLLNNPQYLGSSLYEQQLLKARNAQAPPMTPIQPVALNQSYANTATGLGSAPGANIDTKTLATSNPGTSVGGMPSAGAISGITAGVASLGVAGIDAFSKDPGADEFGNMKPESKGAGVGKSALQGAASGASAGAILGPWGAAGGALIGGAIGFFKGKKDNKAANEQFDQAHSASYGKFYGNQYANQFAAMKGKDGMKMKTAHIMSAVTPSTTLIPKMKHGGSINIIAAGKLHKENNNLGNGDKGIPVINKKGKKIFELEKEEWILNLAATKRAEDLVNNYNKQNDDSVLEELGRLVHSELTANTQDNSDKFGLGV